MFAERDREGEEMKKTEKTETKGLTVQAIVNTSHNCYSRCDVLLVCSMKMENSLQGIFVTLIMMEYGKISSYTVLYLCMF